MATERVHTGAHYPSDVAVGGVIGLAAAALVRRTPHLLKRQVFRQSVINWLGGTWTAGQANGEAPITWGRTSVRPATSADERVSTRPADRSRRTDAGAQEPVGDLVHLVAQHLSQLLRDEMRLTQAEMTEMGKRFGKGGGLGGAGLMGVLALRATVITGLSLAMVCGEDRDKAAQAARLTRQKTPEPVAADRRRGPTTTWKRTTSVVSCRSVRSASRPPGLISLRGIRRFAANTLARTLLRSCWRPGTGEFPSADPGKPWPGSASSWARAPDPADDRCDARCPPAPDGTSTPSTSGAKASPVTSR
ncbi:phosphatase PAP2 family protein [Streptomyces sp. ID05-47C]|nr:phosphatase PAP2 family protein [Streptomyces sp. ID05-47C]